MISYAQNGEDVVLRRIFNTNKGFYIDIGASHPEHLSVTKYFYDVGWTGINVDPLEKSHELFLSQRPLDINLKLAIDEKNGLVEFFEVPKYPELSTFSRERASELVEDGYVLKSSLVETITGSALFEKYVTREVDFLKIDVEGVEHKVLKSIDFSRFRPKVLVIESTIADATFPGWDNLKTLDKSAEWEPHLLSQKYVFAYFDGLNKFYVREENQELLSYFQVGLCIWDSYVRYEQLKAQKELQLHCDIRLKEIELLTEKIKQYKNVIQSIPFVKTAVRVKNIFRPRLGNLNQYAPRPLTNAKEVTSVYKNSFPSISIVTPSYNQGNFIERTIQSVLEQQYPHLEYFVQDGGSVDQTREILRKYSCRLSGWVSEQDGGQSHAINAGFAKTSGEIMAWLNSDDVLLPNTLNTVAEYFDNHPNVDVVYGDRLLIDEDGMEVGRWIMPEHDNETLSWVDFIPQETLFWRRRIWEKSGGKVDESFKFAMDWDLLVRFREAGAVFAHIPQFLGAFRVHKNQKTSADISVVGNKEMNVIRARVLGKEPTTKEIRRAVYPFLVRHLIVDIKFRIKKRCSALSI